MFFPVSSWGLFQELLKVARERGLSERWRRRRNQSVDLPRMVHVGVPVVPQGVAQALPETAVEFGQEAYRPMRAPPVGRRLRAKRPIDAPSEQRPSSPRVDGGSGSEGGGASSRSEQLVVPVVRRRRVV